MTGTVKQWSDAKGYGFIQYEGNDIGAFVHYTAITDKGFKTLREGEIVEFELLVGPKGPQALNVHRSTVVM